jgi:hypothetical protein
MKRYEMHSEVTQIALETSNAGTDDPNQHTRSYDAPVYAAEAEDANLYKNLSS